MRYGFWKSPVSRTLSGVIFGMMIIAAAAVPIAVLLLFLNIPERFLMLLSDLLWCMGSFFAGKITGKHARVHGIRTGIACGILMCVVLMSVCSAMGAAISLRIQIRCLAILPCAVLGGILGVNTRITKPPY